MYRIQTETPRLCCVLQRTRLGLYVAISNSVALTIYWTSICSVPRFMRNPQHQCRANAPFRELSFFNKRYSHAKHNWLDTHTDDRSCPHPRTPPPPFLPPFLLMYYVGSASAAPGSRARTTISSRNISPLIFSHPEFMSAKRQTVRTFVKATITVTLLP